jgi:hypothetical protein
MPAKNRAALLPIRAPYARTYQGKKEVADLKRSLRCGRAEGRIRQI